MVIQGFIFSFFRDRLKALKKLFLLVMPAKAGMTENFEITGFPRIT